MCSNAAVTAGKWGVFVVGSVASLMLVALASGSVRTTHTASAATPSGSSTWLPKGVTPSGSDWTMSGGDFAGSSYSTLTQINAGNVSKLKKVWQLPSLNIQGGSSYRPENSPSVLTNRQRRVRPTCL